MSSSRAPREMTSLLAGAERRLLRAIAARLPYRILSDHLTLVGVLGAIGAGAAYALSSLHPGWLWVASAMLAVNWFGDSLDGTLARVRRAERPRYGYYLDHAVDAFDTAVIGIGIGLSPYVNLELALVLVVLYLMLSINVYLETSVFGVFKMAYGIVGPTEVRLLLIVGNAVLFFAPLAWGALHGTVALVANATAALLAAGMFTLFAVRFGSNLQRLGRMEPVRRDGRAEPSWPAPSL
ncbi:MAG: CDP-alcohol phosphatidyltransferase family protein [Gemmatimonadetes bacterium]|nr:CDP-alcohol phosphatidyltransferase family protein [Gemmatimonadota bacterium]